jgi:broad specificity phosphatase PhoE
MAERLLMWSPCFVPVGKLMPKFGISPAQQRKGVSMIGLLIPHAQEADPALVHALMWTPLSAVYTSPLERAVETANPLAHDHGLDVHVRAALTDIAAADGEALGDVQRRIVEELLKLAIAHQDETIAIITHAEPIRCALAAFTGVSIDDMRAVEISPAHVCAIGIAPGVRKVLGVNVPANEVAV